MKQKGDIIFEEPPFVFAISPAFRNEYCNYCFTWSDKLKCCSTCKNIRYCSTTCQKDDWTSTHREECRLLKAIHPHVPPETVQLMYRLLLRIQKVEDRSVTTGLRCFADLMSHYNDILQDKKRISEFGNLATVLKAYVGDAIEIPRAKELLDIFGKICINSFGISNDQLNTIGVGLYLGPSVLNHSCRPNAVLCFNKTTACVRLTRDVQDEEEVTISYIDQLANRLERRTELESMYYFTCKCSACQDSKLETDMNSSRCDSCEGGQVIEQEVDNEDSCLQCRKCQKRDFSVQYIQRRRDAITAGEVIRKELAETRKNTDFSVRKKQALDLLALLSVLHEMDISVIRLNDEIMDCSIQLEQWDHVVEYGRKTLTGYQSYLQTLHPHLALQLSKIGKVCLFLGQLKEALPLLSEAKAIFEACYGRSNATTMAVSELLYQCQEELRSQDKHSN